MCETGPTARPKYYVYVIALDDKVLNDRKFIERNPNYIAGKPCVYVGQSAVEPKKRFEQHKAGYKASRYPRVYGKYLCHRRFRQYNPLDTRKEALAMEKELAGKLQAKGYGVWWN
jgi:predicted GIY-YIG superfamily endonuclease